MGDDFFRHVADAFGRDNEFATPGELAKAILPATRQTPALDLIDEALVDVAEGRCKRLMVFMPPQEGKSERCSRYFPLWALRRNPDLRIAIASYDLDTARRWGRVIRGDIESHSGLDDHDLDLGLRLKAGQKASGDWRLDLSEGGVYCVGVGGALTGRPVDLMLIDDPVKNRESADSDAIRRMTWDWWVSTVSTRFSPTASVVLIMTRWHEDDLAGRLLAQAAAEPELTQWRVISIPAKAEREDDPLGRNVDEYMVSAREGRNDPSNPNSWAQIEMRTPSRDWAALYQQRPAPESGNILLKHWWQRYDNPRAVHRADGTMKAVGLGQVVMSWDMAFKDTDSSDFVVGQVWFKNGSQISLLDQVRARMDFTATVAAFRRLCEKWPQATLKLVEDKANGPAVIAALRKEISGIVAYNPRGSKLARAHAVAPFCEAGNVWLPSADIAPWVTQFIDECTDFPNGAHDDQVDAFTQAAARLLLEGGPAMSYLDHLRRERGPEKGER